MSDKVISQEAARKLLTACIIAQRVVKNLGKTKETAIYNILDEAINAAEKGE